MNFNSAFDAGNKAAERAFGDRWRLLANATDANGVEYPAIGIEKLTRQDQAKLGGRFADVHTTIEIRPKIAEESGVKQESLVLVWGEALRVREIDRDGASLTLLCGPVGASMPRR